MSGNTRSPATGQPTPGQPPREQEIKVDRESEDSFPASDPPSVTPAKGEQTADPHADGAKGTPDSGRHQSETAAGRQENVRPAEHKAK